MLNTRGYPIIGAADVQIIQSAALIRSIHVTRIGSADAVIQVYDGDAAANGTLHWQGGGTTQCDGDDLNIRCNSGIFVHNAGTTPAWLVIVAEPLPT